MRKRSLALLLGASMVLGLAGCSGGGSTPATQAPAPATTAAPADTAAPAGDQQAAPTEAAKDYIHLQNPNLQTNTLWFQ